MSVPSEATSLKVNAAVHKVVGRKEICSDSTK